MKFDTCSIRKENQKGKAQLQVTFDEDYNLPDYKPDISKVILSQGHTTVEEVRVSKGHVLVKGTITFNVLYRAEQNSLGCCSVSGSIGFQENVAMDQAEEFDTATVSCVLEDLSVHITNSRKLAIRGLMQMDVALSEFVTVEIPCSCQEQQQMELLKEPVEYLKLQSFGKDQCRVHEEVELPANKLNIQSIVWKDLKLEAVTCTTMSDYIQLKGELALFCIYQGEPGIRLEWYEQRIPIVCKIDAADVAPDGVCYVKITDSDWNLQVQEDLEGENRLLVVDGSIRCQYRVYSEEKSEIIKDLYALDKHLTVNTETLVLEQLLMKNDSRGKVNDILALEQGQKEILQILNCSGMLQIDRQEVVKDGVLLEGAICVQVLYLTQDDGVPIDAVEGIVPFQYRVEVPGMCEDCRYELNGELNMLSVMMKNSNALEVQALLDFHMIAFKQNVMNNITQVTEKPLDMTALMALPGITGIRIKPGDSLWEIAKHHHTTRDVVRQNNPDMEEPLKPGSVLLLLKEVQ